MRRGIIAAFVVVMLVALAAPLAADQPDTRATFLVEDEWGPVPNPCTGEWTMLKFSGEWELHALPSVDSFFSGDFTHADGKVTGRYVGVDDGYATEWKHIWTAAINQNENHEHFVQTQASNLMFNGNDGGKYRVHGLVKLVIVGGEVKVSSDFNNVFCVRQPKG